MEMEGLEDIIELFKVEVQDRLSRVEKELLENKRKDIELIYREFHTIKGTAQMLGFTNYSKAAHAVEDVVKPLWKQNLSLPNEIIPRILKVLDVFRSRLGEDLTDEDVENIKRILSGEVEGREYEKESVLEIVSEIDEESLESIIDLAEKALFHSFRKYQDDSKLFKLLRDLLNELRDLYWHVSTVSLKEVLKGFERLVYEEASRENKKARFELDVKNVRIKKDIASTIRDSLVHIVKNSIVHGIELPEERVKAGKNEEGVVRIRAWVDGRSVKISVEDDGKGIDFEKIKRKIKKLGKDVPEEEKDLISVIFEPFFSTKEKADLGGGRGVGLSSVKTFIESIGGKIWVDTIPGKGTRFTIEIPSTKVWEYVIVLRSGIFTYALRFDEVESVKVYEGEDGCRFTGQMMVVLKNGEKFRFDTKVTEGTFLVVENPFTKMNGVAFWIDFLGLPIPVFTI